MNESSTQSYTLSAAGQEPINIANYDWPIRAGLKAMEKQKETTVFVLRNKRGFVLNEMGTGKTLSVLWACDILLRAKKIRRVLIVCPISTMHSVWASEIFLNFPDRTYAIAHGSRDYRLYQYNSNAEFVIINHDGIKVLENEIAKSPPDILIIDELTAFKSHSSDRTKVMTKLAAPIKAVWGLTGEPTPNTPLEAYSQAKIVVPRSKLLWGPFRFFTAFRDATMYKINEYNYVARPEAPNIVAALLQPAVRFLRSEFVDIPPTTYTTLETPLTKEQMDAYKKMKEEAYIKFESGDVTAGSAAIVLNKLLQISAGAVKTNDQTVEFIGCKPRFDMLVEIFEQTPQKKLVIFATYRATIQYLDDSLSKLGYKVKSIFGDVQPNKRGDIINDFQKGDLQILIIQPQSGSHGITLVAASTVVWFSLIPSNEYYRQANARIVRTGQTRNTLIIKFVSTPAEKHINDILDRKAKLSDAVLQLFRNKEL